MPVSMVQILSLGAAVSDIIPKPKTPCDWGYGIHEQLKSVQTFRRVWMECTSFMGAVIEDLRKVK
jgi:hypothetical protein